MHVTYTETLAGNMWAQTWDTLWDIVRPDGFQFHSDRYVGKRRSLFANMTVIDMVKRYFIIIGSPFRAMVKYNYSISFSADDFYISLGLSPMTASFWSNSQFVKPQMNDQDSHPTSCHPSSLDMNDGDDFRMELCGDDGSEDTFVTVHHEMGHVQYYMSYSGQPPLFRVSHTSIYAKFESTFMMYFIGRS